MRIPCQPGDKPRSGAISGADDPIGPREPGPAGYSGTRSNWRRPGRSLGAWGLPYGQLHRGQRLMRLRGGQRGWCRASLAHRPPLRTEAPLIRLWLEGRERLAPHPVQNDGELLVSAPLVAHSLLRCLPGGGAVPGIRRPERATSSPRGFALLGRSLPGSTRRIGPLDLLHARARSPRTQSTVPRQQSLSRSACTPRHDCSWCVSIQPRPCARLSDGPLAAEVNC